MDRLTHNVFIDFSLETLTGLAIGGSDTGIQIGGVDKIVIRNPLRDEPYIPGSSLRGKMRSSLEKALGLPLNQQISPKVHIHSAKRSEDYKSSPVCQLFGVTGENEWGRPSRVLVRDVRLSDTTRAAMAKQRLDMPYTEIKVEVAIDRVTSAAVPRKLERVPAGAVFGPGQIVFSLYEGDANLRFNGLRLFDILVRGMMLVEDSYLGGSGSRGSGQVVFKDISISYATTMKDDEFVYGTPTKLDEVGTVDDLARFDLYAELGLL